MPERTAGSSPSARRGSAKQERHSPPRPARAPVARLVPAARPGWQDAAVALALAGVAVLLYLPSLNGPFVFDDANSVAQSGLIRRLSPLLRFVKLSTRPLSDFSFALDYAQGALAPSYFHRTNIALHALNVALFYALAWLTLGTPALAERYGAARRWIAGAAAAAFAVHPLATETVAYVSSRSEVLVGAFILFTLIVYNLAATRRSTLLRALLPVGTAAALGSKEIAVTLPVAALLYDWCFLGRGDWRQTKTRWKLVALSALPFAAGLLFLLRRIMSPTGLGDYGATAGFGFDRFTRWQYLITQFGVVLHYFRLMIVPVGQTFDYDWPLATGFFTPGVLLPLLVLGGLVAAAVRSVRTWPALTFAVLWTFLILSPTSSVLPIADIAVERRMYMPLAGWALLGAIALWDLNRRWEAALGRQASAAIGYLVLAALPVSAWAYATYERAALWGDAVALHLDGVAKAPGNPRVRLNLGVTYMNLGRLPDAQRELAEAKRLYDLGQSVHAFQRIGAFIHYNLGASLYLQNKGEEAVPQLERALELGGVYLALRPMAYYLLARIAYQQEDYARAVQRFDEALKYNRDNPGWFSELAKVHMKTGNRPEAERALRDGLRFHPGQPELTAALEHLQKMPPGQAPAAARRPKRPSTYGPE